MGENSQVTISNLVAAIKASLGHLLFNHDTLTTGNTLFRMTDEQRHTLYNAFTGKLFTKATALKIHGLQAAFCVCDCRPNVLCNKRPNFL